MSTRIPPKEPFDAQERELARILAALPGGEPPPHLDASILRAAANAAASSRRPHARWLASAGAMWGIGGAAAAVLALGVAWQMRYPAHNALPESAPAAAMSNAAEDSSIPIEFKERVPQEAGNAAPPPPAMEKSAAIPRPRAQPAAPPARQAPQAQAAEPFFADKLDEHVANRAEAGGSAEADLAAPGAAPSPVPMATDAQKSQAYAAKAAVADAESSMAAEAQSSRADQGRSNVVGAASGTLASTADTSRMKPANWLSKIRVLRDAGHHDQAKASLIQFQHMHPDYVIPSDLAPLLRE